VHPFFYAYWEKEEGVIVLSVVPVLLGMNID
jgi:hypothetical protein